MNKIHYLFFYTALSILGSFTSMAQIPELDWVKTFGGTDIDFIRVSRLDAQGNIINVGSFYGTTDFDPGPGQYVLQTASTNAGIFIQKLDANGNFIWARAISSPDHVISRDMEIGSDGAIYVAGTFYGYTVDFDPAPNRTHYVNGSTSSHSMYTLKLDSQGNFVWVNVQSGNITANFMELDTLGNFYQIGTFYDVIDKDPDPVVFDSVYSQSPGVHDFFIQKMDTAGNQLWFKTIRGINDVKAHALKMNSQGELVIAGAFKGPVDFDPGSANYNLSSGGSNSYTSGFILNLDTSGTFQSAVALQGAGDSEIFELQLDNSDNLYIAGIYVDQVDFDPGTGVNNPPSSNAEGYFIEKLNSNGGMLWARPYENSLQSLESYPIHIALDDQNSVYVAGHFYDNDLKLEPAKANGITINNNQLRRMFVAKHGPAGSVHWGYGFLGVAADAAFSMIRDTSGSLYLSGYFMYNINFDPYNSANMTTGSGSFDCFLLKFKSCTPVLAEATLDSNAATLVWDHSSITPGTYNISWYSCDGDSIIPGANDTTFSPAQNGNYALVIANGDCSDTSQCFAIQNIGLEERNPTSAIELYPNPTDNIVYIAGLNGQVATLTLLDITGRKVYEARNQDFLDLSSVRPGTYFILIEVDGFIEVRQVVRRP